MAARRRRSGTRKTAGVRQGALKAAGLLAHNRRLGSAVAARQNVDPKRAMGYNEARISRVRRRGRIANPRMAVNRARGRELAGNAHRKGVRLTAIPSKLVPLSAGARRYKRDSRGRFSRR